MEYIRCVGPLLSFSPSLFF
uniref:Uncharacterized protein n=1 Tax=Rhizophora mucronata TaxID=61149 RepID=A0A2P2R2F0_RHIMU